MPKKIFELANDLKIRPLDLVEKLKGAGFNVRNHMHTLSDEEVQRTLDLFRAEEEKNAPKKKVVRKKKVPAPAAVTASSVLALEEEEDSKRIVTVKRKVVKKKSDDGDEATLSHTQSFADDSEETPDNVGDHSSDSYSASAEEIISTNDEDERFEEEQNEAAALAVSSDDEAQVQDTLAVEDSSVQDTTPLPEINEVKPAVKTSHRDSESLESNGPKKLEIVSYPEKKVEVKIKKEETAVQATPPKANNDDVVLRKKRKPEDMGEDEKPRGLRVVYRPPVITEEEKRAQEKAKQEERQRAQEQQNQYRQPQQRGGRYEEKMHSFTPVYTPPKKPQQTGTTGTSSGSQVYHRRPGGASGQQGQTTGRPYQGNAAAGGPGSFNRPPVIRPGQIIDPTIIDEAADKARRRTGVMGSSVPAAGAATIAPKVVKGKPRDMEEMRADEELKSYAMGIVGKVMYTSVGRKKVYNGPTKETAITEVKDAKRVIRVDRGCIASELAQKLSIKFDDLRDQALDANILLRPQDYMGIGLLNEIVTLYKYRVEDTSFKEEAIIEKAAKSMVDTSVPLRNPVVTVMGHVDHGKTTLLDYIRKTKVAAGEAGGITQHIAAYTVPVGEKEITFLDTPGHAAFSGMRERGAKLTDIVVLVVAADDGVMPQTRECVQFCQANDVPIIVAMNKMDKEGANPDRIKQQLMDFQLTPEEWGGETQYVPISAIKGEGVNELLESITVQAEVMELRSSATGLGQAVVIESKVEVGRGPIVTALVQSGTLNKGDALVAGETSGRARSLMDHSGKQLQSVGPGRPVIILGLDDIPAPGDSLNAMKNEREAKKVVEERIKRRKELDAMPKNKMSLEDFFASNAKDGGDENGGKKVLKLVIRSDVHGSYEAIKGALSTIGNNEVSLEIIGGGVGAISENDVLMANSAKGYLIGFGVSLSNSARKLAEEKGVAVKTYRIIYELIQDVKLALEGLLTPETVERYIGRAEVRNTFNIPKIGVIAGTAVIDGKIERGCSIRLLRDGKIIHEGKISSLKRFKDDVKEVKSGYECGISIENYDKVEVNDVFEAYIMEEKKRSLEDSSARI